MGKLANTKIELDETDNKLFPGIRKPKNKPVLTKIPLSASIKHKGVKKNTKTKRVLGRKSDMEKTIKAQKYASLAILAAGTIYGITRYTQDMVVVVCGTLLVAFLLEKSSK